MTTSYKLLVLPGDGIGPEVMRETKKVIDWFDKRKEVGFDLAEDLVGGASYDKHKTPLTDEVMDKALNADGVLFGAVGGPDYDNLPFSEKPERGLLRLRKELSLFANLRPAIVFDALADAFLALKMARPDEDDIILLGDLNAAPKQFDRLGTLDNISWAVSGTTTNTRRTKTYDNLIFQRTTTGEYTGRWGVLDLQNTYGLSLKQALEVSDHNPVWATFTAREVQGAPVASLPTGGSPH